MANIFDSTYWKKNYSDPMGMDGIGNARDHVNYLKYLFKLDLIDINSIVDLGAGYGHLFQAFLKTFMPYKASAIEPSDYAFKRLHKKKLKLAPTMKIKLLQEDILTWCSKERGSFSHFDLGICTSVFQYVPEEELRRIVPVLATRLKYLYLTVPTSLELKRQRDEIEFHDTYALSRSKKFYYDLLSPHFSFVSSRLLESKTHFSAEDSDFMEDLFRF